MTAPMPAASGLSWNAVREYADRVGRAHSIYDSEGRADHMRLVRSLGGKLWVGADVDLELEVLRPGSFRIFLLSSTSARRDRLAACHGLGHYLMHYLLPEHDFYLDFPRSAHDSTNADLTRMEVEANVFAGALLMPAPEFVEQFGRYDGDPWRLSSHFQVSPLAATERARTLELITTAAQQS